MAKWASNIKNIKYIYNINYYCSRPYQLGHSPPACWLLQQWITKVEEPIFLELLLTNKRNQFHKRTTHVQCGILSLSGLLPAAASGIAARILYPHATGSLFNHLQFQGQTFTSNRSCSSCAYSIFPKLQAHLNYIPGRIHKMARCFLCSHLPQDVDGSKAPALIKGMLAINRNLLGKQLVVPPSCAKIRGPTSLDSALFGLDVTKKQTVRHMLCESVTAVVKEKNMWINVCQIWCIHCIRADGFMGLPRMSPSLPAVLRHCFWVLGAVECVSTWHKHGWHQHQSPSGRISHSEFFSFLVGLCCFSEPVHL